MTYFSYDKDNSERQHLKKTKLTIPYNSPFSLSCTFNSNLHCTVAPANTAFERLNKRGVARYTNGELERLVYFI